MKTKLLTFFTTLFILAGCQHYSTNTFYWGNYSSTLYDMKKNPDEETMEAHKQAIIEIINSSLNKGKKIPPGVYAEFGYILLKAGKEEDGLANLDKEVELYPESLVFVNRIKDEYARSVK